jgi:integrase
MAVYRPKYRDPKTGKAKQSRIWWYHFTFAGRHIQESSKSARKTIAAEAEKTRRRELELAFNHVEDRRHERIRSVGELADTFFEDYAVRNPKSATFARYALRHIRARIGKTMVADVTEETVKAYQTDRLKDKAAPKSINEEVGFLLRILGEQGDFLRIKLRRSRALKLSTRHHVARAYTLEEKAVLLTGAKGRRSRAIYPALMLALHAGMRDAEMRGLQWARLDLHKAILTVGDSKTEAGQGRTIPLNADVLAALEEYSRWYVGKFGKPRPEWYVFPFGKPQPTDPTRPATTFKTVWAAVKEAAGITGRWHDSRHTFITDLAESGEAGDETIRDLAGHVSQQMLKHYSHIRMQAKRRAVDTLVTTKPAPPEDVAGEKFSFGAAKESAKVGRGR